MLPYELTPDVDADLEEIARYTILEWSSEQASVYLDKLHICFQQIAAKKVNSQAFSKQFPHLLATRCEHHYVFYLRSKKAKPVIIAVLHERMDMVNRLKERFG
jgi:plasmid stabilization system protein ParE